MSSQKCPCIVRIAALLLAGVPFLLFLPLAAAQLYVLSTLAGGAPPPTPSIATSDSIYPPTGIAADSAGNVFITSVNCVFQLNLSGVLTRIAGNSRPGFSGDGGLALNAQLDIYSGGVAIDVNGNLYIADAANSRIRRISPTGIITTIAGNGTFGNTGDGFPAVSASFGTPVGVAIDESGNIFVADQSYGVVRRISTDGLIATVYQGPATGSSSGDPWMALTVDTAGNLFVSDTSHNFIREVTPTGAVTTIAGTGTAGFSGDGGPAKAAQISAPRGLAFDSRGNLYFADALNYRIRKIALDGTISTFAGGGTVYPANAVPAVQAALYPPDALAIAGDGTFYLAAGWIQRITPDGILSIVGGNGTYSIGGDGGPATQAQLYAPADVALDAAGNAFIVENGNLDVRRVDTNGVITTVAGNGNCNYSGDGGPAIKASLCAPGGAAVDSSGNLYIADSRNNVIRKVDSSGMITTFAGNGFGGFGGDGGPATRANLNYPEGVAVDGQGNVIIADYLNSRIRKVSPSGTITTIAGTGTQGFSGDGGPAANAELFLPHAVAADNAGNIFFADVNQRIRRISPGGTISTVAGNGTSVYDGDGSVAVNTGIGSPSGVAVDLSGNVFISTAFGKILKVRGDGTTMTVAGNGANSVSADGVPALTAALGGPQGLRVDSSGKIYVVTSSVRVLTPVSESVLIGAVVDGASQGGTSVSPGKILTIYGVGMGPAQLSVNEPAFGTYSTEIAGTTVSINGVAAPLLYVSAAQIGAVVPYATAGTNAQLIVTSNNQSSSPFTVSVAATEPSLFSANGTGAGQAAAVNDDGSVNDALHPARIGGYVSLYVTGEGQTTPAGTDGQVAPLTPPFPQPVAPVSVALGGLPAKVTYAGAAPGDVAGLMQVVVQIPDGTPTGGYLPVVVTIGEASNVAGAAWIAVVGQTNP